MNTSAPRTLSFGAEIDLARSEPRRSAFAEIDAEVLGDLLRERRMGRPREQHHLLLGDDLHACPPVVRGYVVGFRDLFLFFFVAPASPAVSDDARSSSLRFRYPGTMRCSPRSTASAPGGTSFVITDPAPVTAPFPIRTGATSMVSEPIRTSSPMTVRMFLVAVVVDAYTVAAPDVNVPCRSSRRRRSSDAAPSSPRRRASLDLHERSRLRALIEHGSRAQARESGRRSLEDRSGRRGRRRTSPRPRPRSGSPRSACSGRSRSPRRFACRPPGT